MSFHNDQIDPIRNQTADPKVGPGRLISSKQCRARLGPHMGPAPERRNLSLKFGAIPNLKVARNFGYSGVSLETGPDLYGWPLRAPDDLDR